jgi:hypothetical protein
MLTSKPPACYDEDFRPMIGGTKWDHGKAFGGPRPDTLKSQVKSDTRQQIRTNTRQAFSLWRKHNGNPMLAKAYRQPGSQNSHKSTSIK